MKNITIFEKTSLGMMAGVVACAILFALPMLTHADTLYRQLDIGATGSDVTALQTYLAQDSSIYPEGLVTGYFGSLTSAAITRFQTNNELQPVGRVGPKTLVALNEKMSGNTSSTDASAPVILIPNLALGTTTATVTWSTNELAKGTVFYSTNQIVMTEVGSGVVVSGTGAAMDGNFRTSQSVSLVGLTPNTTYFYVVEATDASGNVNVTWPTTFRTNQ